MKTSIPIAFAIRSFQAYLITLICFVFLAGCGRSYDGRIALLPAIEKLRAGRLDIQRGPTIVLLKDKRLLFIPRQGPTPQPFRLADISSISYERAFRQMQLTIYFKPGKIPQTIVLPMETPLSAADSEMKALKKFLDHTGTDLPVQSRVDYESAYGPMKFFGGCVFLILLCYLIGGYFAPLLGTVLLVPLFISWLYSRSDSELVSFAFSYVLQNHAAAIIYAGIPLILIFCVSLWMYSQRQKELHPPKNEKEKVINTGMN